MISANSIFRFSQTTIPLSIVRLLCFLLYCCVYFLGSNLWADDKDIPPQKPPLRSYYPGGLFRPGAAVVYDRNEVPVKVRFTRQDICEKDVAVLKDYPTIEELWLCKKVVKGPWLEHLKSLSALKFLNLESASIDDAGLSHLVGLQKLQYLGLDWCIGVTSDGMKSVAKIQNLETLSLHGVKIGDKGLSNLTSLKKLRELDLERTGITDQGLKYLKDFPNLKILVISPFPGECASQEGIARLDNMLPGVEIKSGLWPSEIEAAKNINSNHGEPVQHPPTNPK